MQVQHTSHYLTINGERTYVGPERRTDKRRHIGNHRAELVLRNFGVDRRIRPDRRRDDTSWLVTVGG